MKIIQDYSNPTLSPNSKIHPLKAMLNINQLGFVNLTYRWSHRSNVWILDFYFSLLFFLQNPLPPKSNHYWNLSYPLESVVVNQRYCAAENPKGQHTWPILNLQSTATKNQRKIVRKNNNYKTYYQFFQANYSVCIQFETSPSLYICIEFSS
jgi:hypothetical protein